MFTGTIRTLRKEDKQDVENIFSLYWSGEEFLQRLFQRLQSAIDNSPECTAQSLEYFIAEKEGEVVGVLGLRKSPIHMAEFTVTENAGELYILAAKYKRQGIGKALTMKALERAKECEYTEIVVYSGETHKESWTFYDHLGFERVASATAPNGELGQVWRKVIK
jgi:N-acetylglutamate synthase-like GNAT family acetyltransferase